MLILNVMLNRVFIFFKIVVCQYLTSPFTSVQRKAPWPAGTAGEITIKTKLALCASVEKIGRAEANITII